MTEKLAWGPGFGEPRRTLQRPAGGFLFAVKFAPFPHFPVFPMSTDQAPAAMSPDELLKRKKEVRKWVVLRGVLLGVLVAAWWIMFVPESIVASTMKYVLGVVVGLVATGGYLYQLRAVFQSSAGD